MIKFRNISEIEKLYPYVKAVAGTDVYNGDFGTVTEGTFALAANAKQVVMNIEVGDDEGLDRYFIAKGSDLIDNLISIFSTPEDHSDLA